MERVIHLSTTKNRPLVLTLEIWDFCRDRKVISMVQGYWINARPSPGRFLLVVLYAVSLSCLHDEYRP